MPRLALASHGGHRDGAFTRHISGRGIVAIELNRYAVWVVLQSSCSDRLSSPLFQFPLLCETMAWLFAAYSISQRRFP
jgi:hypothetical protein